MSTLNFLLEIGVEEIPDWMLEDGLAHLKAEVSKTIESLGGTITLAECTPRRLALKATGLNATQADTTQLLTGPAKGAPEAALAGFAKKNGLDVSQLQLRQIGNAEKYVFEKLIPGQPAREVLASTLPATILGIPWPKTMLWPAKGGARFIRPIRWLLCLLGEEVVPFTINGITSSNLTRGHRQLGKTDIPVTFDTYEQALKDNFVLLSANERRAKILAELPAGVKADAKLLETLTYITEYPTAITGHFSPDYLTLPAEVLVTVMRFHQKYFSVDQADGSLAPQFVAIMNTAADPAGLVRHGNERVLRARFNDARFFYDVDQQKPLSARVEDLKAVTFQAQLGSYFDKTQRVLALLTELGANEATLRAATLAKTDLTCEMVKEFTELQGIIGGLYAKAQGEPQAVATAIYEHYKPLSMEDSVPASIEGQMLSLADKTDTLRGCFSINLIPTGSKDPFALRRAAQGIVKILIEGDLNLSLAQLSGGDEKLAAFFEERIRHYFEQIRGFAYDEVNAVLAAGKDNLKDVLQRLQAVRGVRATPDFEPLAAGFKRIANILGQANFSPAGPVNQSLLEPGPEADLFAAFHSVTTAVRGKSYSEVLTGMASLRPAVDLFFDKTMVNVPDQALRSNRLTLLFSLKQEFSGIAEFSEIVPKT
jgi:glycyl-tRNA synthetase beta chain